MKHYCECGREIKVCIGGVWRYPKDNDHTQCRQCHTSERDSHRGR